MHRLLIIIAILFFAGNLSAQPAGDRFLSFTDSIGRVLFDNVPDSMKIAANQVFEEKFAELLHDPVSATLPPDSLKFIKTIRPDDGTFSMFTWAIPLSGGRHIYSGIMQKFAGDMISDVLLLDESEQPIVDAEAYSVSNWPGAVYFSAIEKKKDKKRFYTLLGWRGADEGQSARIIEAMYFDEDGQPVFGMPVFKMNKQNISHRILFEFTDQVPFHLAWEEQLIPGKKRKTAWMIVFNHLTGNNPAMGRMFRGAVPSYEQFDALVFSDGMW
ncbi:MAG: hypothetical protein ACOCX8_00470, partial [Bacteroidota bacterium]